MGSASMLGAETFLGGRDEAALRRDVTSGQQLEVVD